MIYRVFFILVDDQLNFDLFVIKISQLLLLSFWMMLELSWQELLAWLGSQSFLFLLVGLVIIHFVFHSYYADIDK